MKKTITTLWRNFRSSIKKYLSSPSFWLTQVWDLIIVGAIFSYMLGFLPAKIAAIPVFIYVFFSIYKTLVRTVKNFASTLKGDKREDD